MAFGRMTGGSPLWASRAACGLSLPFYLTLVIFALETMPRFQTGLLLIATSPLLLIQSSTLSTDGINFAVLLCVWLHGGAVVDQLWSGRNANYS